MDFEQAASSLSSLSDESLGEISDLVKEQTRLEDIIENLETKTKEFKKELKRVQEDRLPDALLELGIKSFKMNDGSFIEVKKHYSASIPPKHKEEAFKWLNEHGFGDLIKNQIMTKFVRGQEKASEELLLRLVKQGYTVDSKKFVEPMTLKAFARERVEAGEELPSDLFGLFICDKAKITRKE